MKHCAIYHETKRENRLRLALGFGWVVLAFLVLANGCVEHALASSCPYDSEWLGTCVNDNTDQVLTCWRKNQLDVQTCLGHYRGKQLLECFQDAKTVEIKCLEEEKDIE